MVVIITLDLRKRIAGNAALFTVQALADFSVTRKCKNAIIQQPRVTPPTVDIRKGQYFQPIGNKEYEGGKCKTYIAFSQSETS
jgi:hypothetical protein